MAEIGLDVVFGRDFFHYEPILMAVEPASMAWAAAQRGLDRTGESWEKVVVEWPRLGYVIADGGKGIEWEVKLADEARRYRSDQRLLALDSTNSFSSDQSYSQKLWMRAEATYPG